MKKVTCRNPDGYQGYDGDKALVLQEGDTAEVSDEKHAQLTRDFGETGWFHLDGKAHRPAKRDDDADEE